MTVAVRVDAERLRAIQSQLGDFAHKAPEVTSSALNRAMTNMASNLPKKIRENYHVKAGTVKDTLKVTKSTKSTLKAEVRSSGKVIGLDHYKVNPKTVQPRRKKQLKIAVGKKGGTKQIMGAFIANLNGVKVFKRAGKERLTINRLFGPSVPQMADEENIVEYVNQQGYITFEKRLENGVNRILSRAGG